MLCILVSVADASAALALTCRGRGGEEQKGRRAREGGCKDTKRWSHGEVCESNAQCPAILEPERCLPFVPCSKQRNELRVTGVPAGGPSCRPPLSSAHYYPGAAEELHLQRRLQRRLLGITRIAQ